MEVVFDRNSESIQRLIGSPGEVQARGHSHAKSETVRRGSSERDKTAGSELVGKFGNVDLALGVPLIVLIIRNDCRGESI